MRFEYSRTELVERIIELSDLLEDVSAFDRPPSEVEAVVREACETLNLLTRDLLEPKEDASDVSGDVW